MAITVELAWKERITGLDGEGQPETSEDLYIVHGVVDDGDPELAALDAVHAVAPATRNGTLKKKGVEIDERCGETSWKVRAIYEFYDETTEPSETNIPRPEVNFDTTGGSQHVKYYRGNSVSAVPESDTAAKQNGAIGWDGNTVQGIDIVVPALSMTETHYLLTSTMTPGWWKTISQLTGKVNKESFRGFDAGEVLFMGATGGPRLGEPLTQVMFRFAISPNEQDEKIGTTLTIPSRKGWQPVSVLSVDTIQDQRDLPLPVSASWGDVYEEKSFTGLGIGTDPLIGSGI